MCGLVSLYVLETSSSVALNRLPSRIQHTMQLPFMEKFTYQFGLLSFYRIFLKDDFINF